NPLPERLVSAETKAFQEGRGLRMAMFRQWKLIYSLLDGTTEWYRLPDEKTELAQQDAAMKRMLQDHLHRWLGEEDYWLLYANGTGDFDATVETRSGQFTVFLPAGGEQERDALEVAPNGRALHWTVYPDGKTRLLYFQVAPPDAVLQCDF